MVLKADWVDKDTPGKSAADWTYDSAAANLVAAQVNTNTSKLSGIEANADVTDATNVDAAGAVMNADTSTASMSFVVDEDTMVSDSATKVPTQQSVKAYVDTQASAAITPTAVKTSGYAATPDDLVPCDATSGGFTVTLPEAPANNSTILVKKIDSSANAVTVQRSGADVFNVASGATTLQITLQDQTVAVQYDSGDAIWYVTSHGTPVAALDDRYDGRYASSGDPFYTPQLIGSDDAVIVDLDSAAGADNYLQLWNATGTTIGISAVGADPHLNLQLEPKGAGTFRVYNTAPAVEAAGPSADHDLLLYSKGAGIVKANDNPVGVRVAVPSTAGSAGTPGMWATDTSYLYVCTATNTWVRGAVTFATW